MRERARACSKIRLDAPSHPAAAAPFRADSPSASAARRSLVFSAAT
ncbi:hypothetical protein B8V81_4939 [Paenibacillus pasadenensis]|uniref:Uncharacterized protein n=1 Tax=Paenibacillus pasadenensis TaxID=217090 RepID=A0A2N5N855_9BACL|nr:MULTISPECIES: hypothetical protein [Paenibacillus]PLT46508.1 hypothetical protein B8V81_4939 [Paenibacillus pasadenensis]QGG56915.1 hypothetical protein GE073_15870 [Paenibacillus sp. B01]